MASSERESSPPSLEELSTRGATAFLLPWIIGMAATTNSAARDVVVFVHQPTRSITLMEGSLEMEPLLREVASKEGPLPASKASIDSLPRVQVSDPGSECPICLAEYEVTTGSSEVKEMPCRHRFHSGCIDKWLGIHGSCPVCRYSMPAEEEKKEKEERDGDGWRIHVFFARGRRAPGTGMESGQNEDSNSGSGFFDDPASDELAAEDMQIDDSRGRVRRWKYSFWGYGLPMEGLLIGFLPSMDQSVEKLAMDLRLTEDEEEGLHIPSSAWRGGVSEEFLFRPARGMEVRPLEANRFLLKFQHVVDRDRALGGCPWTWVHNLAQYMGPSPVSHPIMQPNSEKDLNSAHSSNMGEFPPSVQPGSPLPRLSPSHLISLVPSSLKSKLETLHPNPAVPPPPSIEHTSDPKARDVAHKANLYPFLETSTVSSSRTDSSTSR
ncbi:E3 ubiquitin-protein ligase MP [Sesamum alatum]|uniref:RING-type E3 ubiquitin transferase n=1 Tax=Sesamum alatum TaxID=300844 RepID=A0AAE1Y9K8_9LAMI|nr:E3 ubiquitin-protein ligase MP [Sesamum alatum]